MGSELHDLKQLIHKKWDGLKDSDAQKTSLNSRNDKDRSKKREIWREIWWE